MMGFGRIVVVLGLLAGLPALLVGCGAEEPAQSPAPPPAAERSSPEPPPPPPEQATDTRTTKQRIPVRTKLVMRRIPVAFGAARRPPRPARALSSSRLPACPTHRPAKGST